MFEVLVKALTFILIICIGYGLKKKGFFSENDYKLIAKIVMYITLPGAVITSFAHFKLDYSLFAAVGIGLFGNVFMIVLAFLFTKRETSAAKIFYIFSMAGYNIGNFTLPFVQSFLGNFGVIVLCMFDVGNSIMCTGLTYAIAASCVGSVNGKKEPVTFGGTADKMLHSAPFMVYISMLLLALLNIKLPDAVYTFTNILGSANTFLSMLMIGMMFELNISKQALGYIREIIVSRYIIGIAGMLFFLFAAPFSREVNVVLAAAFLAPSTAVGPIFIEKMGGNAALASVVNSLTILCSIALFIAFFTFIHI